MCVNQKDMVESEKRLLKCIGNFEKYEHTLIVDLYLPTYELILAGRNLYCGPVVFICLSDHKLHIRVVNN